MCFANQKVKHHSLIEKRLENAQNDVGNIMGLAFARSMIHIALVHGIETNLFTKPHSRTLITLCYGLGIFSGLIQSSALAISSTFGSYPKLKSNELLKPAIISLLLSCATLIPYKLNLVDQYPMVGNDEYDFFNKPYFYFSTWASQLLSTVGLKRAAKDNAEKQASLILSEPKKELNTKHG